MGRSTRHQLAHFFGSFLRKQKKGWGNPQWAENELDRLMQWKKLELPGQEYKHHN